MRISILAEVMSLDSFHELSTEKQLQVQTLAQQFDNIDMQMEMLGSMNFSSFNLTDEEREKYKKHQILFSKLSSISKSFWALTKQYNLYRETDNYERDILKR